jgi:hypothetical protein
MIQLKIASISSTNRPYKVDLKSDLEKSNKRWFKPSNDKLRPDRS